jgi:hypothetical protein
MGSQAMPEPRRACRRYAVRDNCALLARRDQLAHLPEQGRVARDRGRARNTSCRDQPSAGLARLARAPVCSAAITFDAGQMVAGIACTVTAACPREPMIHRPLNLLDSAGDNREREYGGCDRLVVAFLPISRILRLLWLFSPLSKPNRSVEAPENSAYAKVKERRWSSL